MKPVEVPTAEPRSGSPVPDVLGFSKGARGSRPRTAMGARTAGQIIAALALTSPNEFEKPQLKSCFRSARPTLASFDVDWFRTICLAARNLDHVHLILRMFHEGSSSSSCAFGSVGPTRFAPIFELLVDVPDSLLKSIKSRRVLDDPIAVACEQRILGFAASDLDRVIEMNDARRKTMAVYAAHGLFDGFTVPFCVPGEPRGYCSFGFRNPEALTIEVMAIINLAAAMLFEAASSGRAAAWDALNRTGTAPAAASGGADGGAPTWARELRAEQAARHHRHAALQTLKEGDRGGASATPDIKERED